MSQPPTESGSSKSGTPSGKPGAGHVFQAPTGTRDMYPADLARLRYVQDAWRRTSINHGFEEIDGPTFEHLDLYTVKSGEGIVSELFSFERFGGEKTFALRPEFTPTLARMYATKAASLPKPTKWFWMQNCFRAERPQRGRLREFWQWNCDVIGGEDFLEARLDQDAEVIACCISLLRELGLTSRDVRVKINHRGAIGCMLTAAQILEEGPRLDALRLIDEMPKMSPEQLSAALRASGITESEWAFVKAALATPFLLDSPDHTYHVSSESAPNAGDWHWTNEVTDLRKLFDRLRVIGMAEWCEPDLTIARGLAYYTGMVFEVHEASGAERAIAGGGRYDKLIEMFGGPPTPAVGFGMGDVVLSLVLADKGLMPKDDEIASRLGLNPDAVVVSNGTPEADGVVAKVVADLRRAGLHARRSTKKIGKAIQDAAKVRARYCVILESATQATVKDMGTQEQAGCGVGELVERVKRR